MLCSLNYVSDKEIGKTTDIELIPAGTADATFVEHVLFCPLIADLPLQLTKRSFFYVPKTTHGKTPAKQVSIRIDYDSIL